MSTPRRTGAEARRLGASSTRTAGDWKEWGPYLSERAWGTVREDYSRDGTAWESFPHDHARSRAYRWNEDGLAGVCDLRQRLCLAVALWNERDPILKERLFGLTGNEGNHGEDVKEYWWYVDSTPTHSWMRWRYHYPQAAFPYARLVAENRARTRRDPEFELADTDVFADNRYWVVTVDYAKAAPDDLCARVTVRNAGPEAACLHVLPTLWFRNTWSWGLDERRPRLLERDEEIVAEHVELGTYALAAGPGPDGDQPIRLFCENDTNSGRLFGVDGAPFPKDGINDHVVSGASTVNPAGVGTKAAFWYRLDVAGGASVTLTLRLRRRTHRTRTPVGVGDDFDRVMERRQREADEFYASLTPRRLPPDAAAVMRQAFAGMLWSKQLYHYDVDRWLEGDPAGPPPPSERRGGRNAHWRHLNNLDVISMPDKWEYPWYASWDLAFHCVALAHIDPDFAKHQLSLICREWYMHPNGQLPAYEWSFDDVNPPVHGWAALRVFDIDGAGDYRFLEAIFHKLLINFTWWVNRKDLEGNNLFEGGFLGLDNIGPFDRSSQLPFGVVLEQSDATAWMAMYCLNPLEMALVLADHDDAYEDVATKFFEHFAYISTAMNERDLWDETLHFYTDVVRCADGQTVRLRARSSVGLVPLFACAVLDGHTLDRHRDFAARVRWFVTNKPEYAAAVAHLASPCDANARLLAMVDADRLRTVLGSILAEDRFLSRHGVRSLSREHADAPLVVHAGGTQFTLGYEPAESETGQFGGNSNWRGPIWFPFNYLLIEALRRYHRHLGDDYKVEHPSGSGRLRTLGEVADDLRDRLISLFSPAADGSRPALAREPAWADDDLTDVVLFHEYFHGDTGHGLGASHQTGWTGLVADLLAATPRPTARPRSGARHVH